MADRLTKETGVKQIIDCARDLYSKRPTGDSNISDAGVRKKKRKKDGVDEVYYVVSVSKFQENLLSLSGSNLYDVKQTAVIDSAANIKRAMTSAKKSIGIVMAHHGMTPDQVDDHLSRLSAGMVEIESDPVLTGTNFVQNKDDFLNWLK